MTLAFEALAWGRHVDRVGDAWDVVRRADHPAVTLAVDTFHMLARGDDGSALAGIPGDRIGFLQVADAPVLDMNVLEWSRHHRCFPGQGSLDVEGVVAATLAAGYRGPLSLEVFSDVVRESDPRRTAQAAMRSLLFLEDRVAARVDGPAAELVTAAPPPPQRVDAAFLEVASAPGDASVPRPAVPARVRPRRAARHQAGALVAQRRGARRRQRDARPAGRRRPPSVSARRRSPRSPTAPRRCSGRPSRPPAVSTRRRCPGSPHRPACTSSSAPGRGGPGDWQGDFVPTGAVGDGTLTGIDHVGRRRRGRRPRRRGRLLPHAVRASHQAPSRSSWSRRDGCGAGHCDRRAATSASCSTSRRPRPATPPGSASTRWRCAPTTSSRPCAGCASAVCR